MYSNFPSLVVLLDLFPVTPTLIGLLRNSTSEHECQAWLSLSSSTTVLFPVTLGLPLLLCPWGFQLNACIIFESWSFRWVRVQFISIFASLSGYLLLMLAAIHMLEAISGQYIFKMLLKHRCLTTWILCLIFKTLTKFHNHTPKLTLRFKLLLNILNFVLVVKSTSPSGYSYTNAPFAFLILAMKLLSAPPVFVDKFSIYIKVSTSSTSFLLIWNELLLFKAPIIFLAVGSGHFDPLCELQAYMGLVLIKLIVFCCYK